MTKKDYELIANAIRDFDNDKTKIAICKKLAKVFEEDNRQFRKYQFLEACNIILKKTKLFESEK